MAAYDDDNCRCYSSPLFAPLTAADDDDDDDVISFLLLLCSISYR